MARKISSKSDKAQHIVYKTQQRWSKNRKVKLLRALKKNPNNLQIVEALKSITYRRGTPSTQVWSHSNIADAKLIKSFGGSVHRDMFNSNRDVRKAAWRNTSRKIDNKKTDYSLSKGMFTVKDRGHNKGMSLWG